MMNGLEIWNVGGSARIGAVMIGLAATAGLAVAGETVEVTSGPFEAKVAFDGVFEATRTHAISVAPREFATLEVVEAVSHGARVRAGTVLVRFDTEDLEKQIRDSAVALETGARALRIAETELAALEQTTPLDLAAARRGAEEAAEALGYFESTGRPLREKGLKRSMVAAEFRVENAREELDQLRKMYEADDLTEETEEIILKRAQNDLESALFFLEQTRLGNERELAVEIPRAHHALREAARRAAIQKETAERTLPPTLESKRIEVDKLREDHRAARRRHGELEGDLERLTVTAPFDGFVYYGEADNGRWTTAAAAAKKLKPGGKPAPEEILMTLVDSAELRVRALVPENLAGPLLGRRLGGTVTPVAWPLRPLEIVLSTLVPVPDPAGGFPATFLLAQDAVTDGLAAGMTGKVEVTLADEADALVVPVSAVIHREGRTFVDRAVGDRFEETAVVLGAQGGDRVQVRKGLKAGDRIRVDGNGDDEKNPEAPAEGSTEG